MQARFPLRLLAGLAACLVPLPAPAAPISKALTRDARQVYEWIARSKDHEGLPFMIIDKRQAHLWVFDRAGQLQGNAPVLLGAARGDHSLPGIGDMPLSQIRPQDRTTPAGRFKVDVGRNLRGETVVWVDYDGGVSMHPVLTTSRVERREQRLATPTAADNRVSFGCINVPAQFHETVVLGTVQQGPGIVYILPDSRPLTSVFAQLARTAANGTSTSSSLR